MSQRQHHRRPGGFTLLESRVAAFLIGLVIAALAASSGAFTMATAGAIDLSTAEFLIEEIRELTAVTDYGNLFGLSGSYSPPIDVVGMPLNDFAAFEQGVSVVTCGADFSATDTDFVRITVTISKDTRPVSEASWIRARLN